MALRPLPPPWRGDQVTSNVESVQSLQPEPAEADAVRRFAVAAFRRLGWSMENTSHAGVFRLAAPDGEEVEEAASAPFTFDKHVYDAGPSEVELVVPGGRFMTYLIDQVRSLGSAAHARAAEEPTVAELSGLLFAAYRIDGGRCRLDGCTLEDQPVLHVTARIRVEAAEPRESLIDLFLDPTGRTLTDPEVTELGLLATDSLIDCEPPPRPPETLIASLLRKGREAAERRAETARRDVTAELEARRDEEKDQLHNYYAKTRADLESRLESESDARRRSLLQEQLQQLGEVEADRLAALESRYSATASASVVSTVLIWRRYAEGGDRGPGRGSNLPASVRRLGGYARSSSDRLSHDRRREFSLRCGRRRTDRRRR